MDIDAWNKRVLKSKGINATPPKVHIVRNVGDLQEATLWDGETKVRRQEYIFVEGHGLVKCINSELHFVFQTPKTMKGWGLYCFPENTRVNVLDKSIPIQDVRIGNYVLTHTGDYKKVLRTYKRKYSGGMVKIKPSNMLEFSCTEDHPFLVERDGDYVWTSASEIQPTDFLLESVLGQEESADVVELGYNTLVDARNFLVPLEKDLFRLCGYYLAEGHTNCSLKGKSGYSENKYKKYSVWFSFNVNERKYIDDVRELMMEYFGVSGNEHNAPSGNGTYIVFNTRKGYEFFSQMLENGAENKSISQILLHCSNENKMEMMKSLWFGDGASSVGGIEISTTSPHLEDQVRRILCANGIFSSVNIRTKDKHKSSMVRGHLVEQKNNLYRISIYGKSAERFSEFLDLESNYNRPNSRENNPSISDDGLYVKYPISSVRAYATEEIDVYNLEVDGDNSYHANGIISHNCTCGSIAGVVGYAAYSKLASPMSNGKIIACIRLLTTKQNTGIARHADESTE